MAGSKIINRPVLILIVFGLLFSIGCYTITQLPISLFPTFNPPIIMVVTTYTGASAETMEKEVTKVLESSLTSVSGLKKMTSTSQEGSSVIKMQFNYGDDMESCANSIRDKTGSIQSSLPTNCDSPSIFKFDSSSMPIMEIAVQSNRSANELRKYTEDNIEPAFERISGVAEASVSGGRSAVVRVDLSQNRLNAFGLTIPEIVSDLAKANVELGGGSITENIRNYTVKTSGAFQSVDEIAQTVVATKNNYNIKLSDIANVYHGYETETSSVLINGKQGVYLSITKQSDGNSVQVANNVYAQIKEIQKIIPQDIHLVIVQDDTEQIRNTINTLIRSAFEGILLSMLVIFFFLRSWKSTLIIGLSIPLSLVITMLAMYLFNFSLNMMTMTGLILGVGMIVDDSIVILENITRFKEKGTKPIVAAALGSNEMRSAVMASTLTVVFVFIPIIFFKNKLEIIGIIFQDMIFTIIIALLCSLVIALFLVPVLTSHYLPLNTRKEKPLKNRILIFFDSKIEGFIRNFTNGYKGLLEKALNHKVAVVLLVLCTLVGSIALLGKVGLVFAPQTMDSSITLTVELPVGTSLDQTKAVMNQLGNDVKRDVKGYKNLILTSGSGSSSHFSVSSQTYKGTLLITLPSREQQIDSTESIKVKLRKYFADYPGATFTFSQSQGGQLSGNTYPINVTLKSNDLDLVIKTAQQMEDVIKKYVPEAKEVTMDMNLGMPQVEVVVDRKRAYALGLDLTTITEAVAYSIAGDTATTYVEGGTSYDVIVALQDSDKTQTLDLNKIYVKNSSSNAIPLANFASLVKGTGPVSINRLNQSREVMVEADIQQGASLNKVEEKVRQAISDHMIINQNVFMSFEGDWATMVNYGTTFILILIMAILLVFGVMAAQYESFKSPLINLCTLPLMVIGVVLIYYIMGKTFSLFTMVGLVMLVGIVVKNGIVLVDYTNLLRGRGRTVREACIEAGATRLRPVLMTSLTAILGMVPMAFFPGESSELLQPIGLTIIGGLTSATIMTLFFIPTMYAIFNRKIAKKEALAATKLLESKEW